MSQDNLPKQLCKMVWMFPEFRTNRILVYATLWETKEVLSGEHTALDFRPPSVLFHSFYSSWSVELNLWLQVVHWTEIYCSLSKETVKWESSFVIFVQDILSSISQNTWCQSPLWHPPTHPLIHSANIVQSHYVRAGNAEVDKIHTVSALWSL